MKKIILFLIKIYQQILSPDHAFWAKSRYPQGYCKFYPSCSQYSYKAIKKFGIIKGLYLAIARVIRCNPWSRGGFDPINKK